MKYISSMILIAALITLSGCGSETTEEGAIVDHGPEEGNVDVVVTDETDNESDDSGTDNSQEDDTDTKALLEQMNEDAGLVEDDTEDDENSVNETDTENNETSEDAEPGIHEITMINFQGEPEDLEIEVGNTVKWTSEQPNFRHRINIMRYEEDGTKSDPLLDPGMELLNGQTVEHIFNETGEYMWYSTTNYPDTSGDITVE
ncbi:hypothetical protein GF336_01190 [Candidatus Woesearchaeota archaeon]|nr:hypothetical protein [Candidatus Woesearchaeota archaeon]